MYKTLLAWVCLYSIFFGCSGVEKLAQATECRQPLTFTGSQWQAQHLFHKCTKLPTVLTQGLWHTAKGCVMVCIYIISLFNSRIQYRTIQ